MSHRTTDQFETEPNSFYSGSYTDGIYQGSLWDSHGRIRVASKSSGSVELMYARYYSDYVDHSGSNRTRSLGVDTKFRSFISVNELYQDTILPDIHEAFLVNQGVPTLSITEAGIYPVILERGGSGNPVGKLVFATYGTTASYPNGTNVADSTWFSSYPFQGRYRNVRKNVPASVSKFNVSFPASESQVSYGNVAKYGVNEQTDRVGVLATISVLVPRISLFYPTTTGITQTEPLRYTMLDVTGSVSATSGTFLGNGSALFPPSSSGIYGVGFGTVRPQEKQLIKLVYGFGDFFNGMAMMETAVSSSKLQTVAGVCNNFYAPSAEIRGWRYGVVSGFPFYTTCVFRSSRYGQFRDMLEQRKTTKFFDPQGLTMDGKNNAKKGATSAVVQVAFVSGSDAFVTSSNPSVLNLTDSGIYDFECKAGRPWYDV